MRQETMLGLDTNVLVRFLLRDDPIQAEFAFRYIEKALEKGEILTVGLLTILETEWVLRSSAKLPKETIISTFKMLLESRDLRVEKEVTVEEALYLYENSNADFADCLIATGYKRNGCRAMITFDRKAANINGFILLKPQGVR